METREDNRHLKFLYPLLVTAVGAVALAILIPFGRWALSSAGLATLCGFVFTLKSVGIIPKRTGENILMVMMLVGTLWVGGFLTEFGRQQTAADIAAYQKANHQLLSGPVMRSR